MRVVFSTGNDGKYEETCHGLCALAPSVVLTRCDVDPEEVQGSCDDIARQKTLTALRLAREQGVELSGADYFMTEDVSFHLDCLNGFPGPYVKDFLEAVGEAGLWELVRRFDNAIHGARTVCTLAVVDLRTQPETVQLHRGTLSGTVVQPRGDVRHGKRSWNSSFQPVGEERTFGEMPLVEQALMSHRHKALAAFVQAMQ